MRVLMYTATFLVRECTSPYVIGCSWFIPRGLKACAFLVLPAPQLWHVGPVIADHEFVIGQIEGLPRPFLAFEPRIACLAPGFAPLEEVLEGGSHIYERALDRTLG